MNRFAWMGVALLAVALVAVVGLPVVVKQYAQTWLLDQGIEGAAIEDVDLNLFAGTLRVESLRFPGPGDERGAVDLVEANFEWTKLFVGQILLSRVAIVGGQLDVRKLADGRFAVGGLTLPPGDSDAEAAVEPTAEAALWPMGLDAAVLENLEITYRDDQLSSELVVGRVQLGRIATWDSEGATQLVADLVFDGAAIEVQADVSPLAAEPGVEARLAINRAPFAAYAPLFELAELRDPRGFLSLNMEIVARAGPEGTVEVAVEGTAQVEELALTLPMAAVESGNLDWSGAVSATVFAEATEPPLLAGAFDLTVAGVTVRDPAKPLELLALSELAIRQTRIEGLDRIRLQSVALQELSALRGADADEATLVIAHTLIEEIDVVDRSAVTIGRVLLDSLVAQVERQQDGQLKLVAEAFADPPAAADAGDAAVEPLSDAGDAAVEPLSVADDAAPAVTFQIAEIVLGGDSKIRYRDNAVAPVVSGELILESFRLVDFGNADVQRPATVAFEIRQGDGTSVVAEGEMAVFAAELAADLTMGVKGLDLSQVSAYVPSYHIQRGRLSLDTHAKVSGETLDVTNAIVVEKLKLSAKSAGETGWLGEGMAMPLDVALGLLRDRDDRIVLALPISGSLDDPQFDTRDIVRVAMQKALQNAALSYAKNALQPLGTILLVANIAGKAARPRFEPVAFAAGSVELSPDGRAYLEKVAQLLGERPGLSITFCGISTAADLDVLRAQVPASDLVDAEAAEPPPATAAEVAPPPTFESERLQLAQARGEAVQQYLATAHSVDAERMFRCRATLESASELPPRVEIML